MSTLPISRILSLTRYSLTIENPIGFGRLKWRIAKIPFLSLSRKGLVSKYNPRLYENSKVESDAKNLVYPEDLLYIHDTAR